MSMAATTVPTPFLSKTYDMVDNPTTNDVVSWSVSGNTFVVWKQADFARDLLPMYFKHNNFSSFVRQLNTYGFRKTVPDKWEFANENFKRGRKELLGTIKRRTASQSRRTATGASCGNSTSNSGGADEDMGSTSTGSVEVNLSGENEKLKKDNEKLSSELERTKKQCDELVAFLRDTLKVGPDQIDRVIREGTGGSTLDAVRFDNVEKDDDENVAVEEEESVVGDNLKVFGVWLKGEEHNGNYCQKRGLQDQMGLDGPNAKTLKTNV